LKPFFAYIDAGTGSLLVQLLAGGLAGLAAFMKFRWSSIRHKFGKGRSVPEATAIAEE